MNVKKGFEKDVDLIVNGQNKDFTKYNAELQRKLKLFYDTFNISEETIQTLVQNPQFALGIKDLTDQTDKSIKALFQNYQEATGTNVATAYNTGLATRIWEAEISQSVIFEVVQQPLPFVAELLMNKETNGFTLGERITNLSKDTSTKVADWLESSLMNGNSFKETSMGVRDIMGYTIEGKRQKGALAKANRITRTEMRKAYTTAQDLANDDLTNLGIESTEIWMAALDRRTRAYHMAADYQIKGSVIKDAFIVGGEAMKHPLDPAGSAANVINCRCYVQYTSEPNEKVTRAVREHEGVKADKNKNIKAVRKPLPKNLEEASWRKWKSQRLSEMGIDTSF